MADEIQWCARESLKYNRGGQKTLEKLEDPEKPGFSVPLEKYPGKP